MNPKAHQPITEEQFKRVIKDVLGARKSPQTLYENRKPSKEELNKKWKLVKR